MNVLTLFALMAMTNTGFAYDDFGGIKFHSSVEKSQVAAIKNDLRYLYENPITAPDAELLSIGEISGGDGLNMHNWLLNRVKYVIGEKFELNARTIVSRKGSFPSTPQPDLPDTSKQPPKGNTDAKVVMSNIGTALYVSGKQQNIYIGLKFGKNEVYASSPRTGVLQVDEGLFLPKFMINKDVNAPANSIFRLGTLFHEARHSDGNGKSTGFFHDYCPEGHSFAGYFACESSGNGPYTIGALTERHLLQNCSVCTVEEKTAMEARVIDSFNRVLVITNAAKISELQMTIETTKTTISAYELILSLSEGDKKTAVEVEISKMKSNVASMEAELNEVKQTGKQKAPFRDANPEGDWAPVSLQASKKLMDDSLGALRKGGK